MKKTVYVDMDGVLADYLGRCKELNIDPVTGKILHLNDVVQNMDSLSSALEEAICKQVPSGSLKDNLSHKLQDILEETLLMNK